MKSSETHGTTFFIHSGPLQPYVWAAILQARAADPRSTVVVLGDQPVKTLAPEISTRMSYGLLENYVELAEGFAGLFRFEGRNSFEYELLNFQRWFFIRSYCESHHITGPIVALDSDAYLFMPIAEIVPRLTTAMTVVDRVGPQFTYFQNTHALAQFTAFLTESFSSEAGFQRLKDFVIESQDAGLPHVSDMAAIGLYAQDQHLEDLGKPDRTNFIFCENIGSSQGLVMSTLGKRITKRGGRRYFTTRDGRSVLAGGVHLQGGNKVLWPFFVDATVRKQMSKHSPADFRVARREALRKLVGISLLKTASVVRRLVTIRR